MKILLLIFSIFLLSCSNPNTEQEANKQEDHYSSSSPKKKIHLDTLVEHGFVVADSSEDCDSKKWNGEPQAKIVFNYPEGNKLILEEWQYPVSDGELRLFDFLVYDCTNQIILLQSNYTIASYQLIDTEPELRIQINAELPNKNNEYEMKPFLIKSFKEDDSSIVVNTDKIFDVPPITEEEYEQIIEKLNSDSVRTNNIDVIMSKLFRSSLNGNLSADSIFSNLNNYYQFDGSYGEFYSELKYLLEEASH